MTSQPHHDRDRAEEGRPPARAREARERLLRQAAALDAPLTDLRHRIRHVVLLASSSRGGSSVLAEILRHSDELLHFRAEINLFLVLSGHAFPDSGTGSDALSARDLRDTTTLELLLARDVGRLAGSLGGDDDVERFAAELHWRLGAQWPLERLDIEDVTRWTRETLAEAVTEHGWAPGEFRDPQLFHALLLRRVRASHPAINPWYYDLHPDLIGTHFPGMHPSLGPPSPLVFEEPPFITIAPWRTATAADVHRPLVIKTPSNVYRMDFWRAVFPRARVRVLHLTRNAAASINGLVDGWCFRGFYAHRLPAPLAIRGYSDVFPRWGDRWWKFDLPPGWRDLAQRPLVEVCAAQWRTAHRATLADLEATGADHLRLRFEDVVGPRDVRRAAFERLTGWLGIPLDEEGDGRAGGLGRLVETGLPPIMATSRPRIRRWYDNAEILEPVLGRPEILDTMAALGYPLDPTTWT